MNIDNRRATRIPFRGMVEFTQPKFGTMIFDAASIDISSYGIHFSTAFPLSVGDEMTITMKCAGMTFERPVCICWTRESDDHGYHAGCVFTLSTTM